LNTGTFVLVHGAWHSGACWRRVADLLIAQGFTVLTPDLPGHGANSLPLAKVTFRAYVNSLLELLDSLPEPVTLVGHSMAGLVISEVAALRPGKMKRVVYVCAYLPRDGESLFDLVALNRSHEPFTAIDLALQMSDDKRTCTVDPEQIVPLFYTLAPAAVAAAARASFSVQATLPLAAKVQLEESVWSGIRRTYILCTQDKVIPVHHQRRMLTRQHCDVLLQLDADHSPFLSCPEQFALLLQACQDPAPLAG
jgi:pimeloyl-ACP methyl ester carboxylesterase